MRAAIYARYSTEMQREASIEDQTRICRRLIVERGWEPGQVYADMGMSGASHLRPGFQRLLKDARIGLFDILLAESLDRLSRDQEHIAALHKQMAFLGIPIVTIAEGQITELHIGLKGTMGALFLKDLAQKTHRGLEGRVRQGKSAGGVSFGYKVHRALQADGSFTTGERTIDPAEAAIVQRIFSAFATGKSPRAIASMLNKKNIPGPQGRSWGASTIYGNWRRGTGILNNELYVGQLVWNRQRFIKDPATGKRQARPNPPEEWVIEEVPALRIVQSDLWEKVKARQKAVRGIISAPLGTRPERAHRPKYLFSGMLTCGCCGGGYTLTGKTYYGCASARNKGTCDNRRTIKREVLETKVLTGLREQLLHPDLIREFVAEYQREYNSLMMTERADRTAKERELAQVRRKIDQIIDAITEGMFHPSMKAKMTDLEDRKAELELELRESTEEEPIRLHPGLSEVYRRKVADLTTALNDDGSRTEATALLRALLQEIRLMPEGDGLAIELVGELAAIMALGDTQKQTARSKATGGSLTMVAGTGFEPVTFRL